MQNVLSDPSPTQSPFYFHCYFHRAMKKAGLGDEYVRQLKPWR